MNKVTLIGRLTKDPELRATQSGKSLATFTLAVTKAYKKDTENNADFLPCTAWEGTAETISKYVKKGHRIAVSGRLETSVTEKDDRTYKNFFVTVMEFEFLEPKTKSTEEDEENMPEPTDEELNNIPF